MNQRKSTFGSEFAIIPHFMVGLAAIFWAAMLIAFLVLIPRYVPDAPPFPAMVVFAIVGGAATAAYLLLIGYVNQDAKRRDMGQVLWTFLVILIPYGFGFLAYFVLRKPMMENCPKCGLQVQRGFHYCPKCGCGLTPACPHCGQVVQRDYVCCPYCGKALGVQSV
jgi:RNA polymerase subunit RPABC4/transcription elongation factor Spt4